MIGKILAYLAGFVTGFMIGAIFATGVFDYIFKFVPLGA